MCNIHKVKKKHDTVHIQKPHHIVKAKKARYAYNSTFCVYFIITCRITIIDENWGDEKYDKLVRDIYNLLNENGQLIFSQEHPLYQYMCTLCFTTDR